MSRLSAIGNAIILCLSGGRCHREKRKCEQRRSGGGELFRSRFHLVLFPVSQGRPTKDSPARDPR